MFHRIFTTLLLLLPFLKRLEAETYLSNFRTPSIFKAVTWQTRPSQIQPISVRASSRPAHLRWPLFLLQLRSVLMKTTRGRTETVKRRLTVLQLQLSSTTHLHSQVHSVYSLPRAETRLHTHFISVCINIYIYVFPTEHSGTVHRHC